MKSNRDIESIFRHTFEGYSLEPSPRAWQQLSRKLALRKFLRFSWSSVNIYTVTAIATAGIAAWLIFHSPAQQKVQEAEPVSGIHDQHTEKGTIHQKDQEQVTPGRDTDTQPAEQNIPLSVTGDKNDVELNDNHSPGVQSSDIREPAKAEHPSGDQTKMADENMDNQDNIPLQPAPTPEAGFEMDTPSGCPPLTIRFKNTSTHYTSLQWHFGDQSSSSLPDPEYIFDEPGTHIVTLNVVGTDDSVRTVTDTVTVFGMPEARFEMMVPQEINEDIPVSFYNYSVDAVSSYWDFGDHTTSTLHDPIHHYTGEGPFDVLLKVTSADGCVDSMVMKQAFEKNPYYIRFPDAFVPDPNGPSGGYYTEGMNVNAVFHPVSFGVMDYQLRIFNRFGELIFESKDINRGWDGYINGTMASTDVYIWKVHGTFNNGKPFMQFGNVTLVKR